MRGMLSGTLFDDTARAAAATVPSGIDFAVTDEPAAGTVYSGVKFDADGNVYRRTFNGSWQKAGAWMGVTPNTAYHIHRTVSSGTLTTDAGDDIVLSSDRTYDVQVTAPGNKTVIVTFSITNVAGSTTYDTDSYTFSATMESP